MIQIITGLIVTSIIVSVLALVFTRKKKVGCTSCNCTSPARCNCGHCSCSSLQIPEQKKNTPNETQ